VAWIWWEPSLSPTRWGSLGTVAVLLLAVGLNALGARAAAPSSARLVMIGALLAFVAWSFASILWADSRNSAWTGADKTLIYAASFLLLSLWPWDDRDLILILGVFSAAIAGSGAAAVAQFGFAHEPGALLEDGRLIYPMGYANSNAAVWMLGALPAVYLAASRIVPPLLRGVAAAAAVALVELAVLAQSRGWLFVLPFAVALCVLLVRERLRLLVALAVTGLATLAVLRQLLDVYDRAVAGDRIEPAVDRAAILVGISALVAGLVVAGWAVADRRVEVPLVVRRALGGALVAIVTVGVVTGGVLLALEADDPGSAISEHWHDFTRGYSTGSEGSRFTGSLGTDRYQQWRIAWSEFVDHPATGIGADNFAVPYLLHREDNVHEPFFPHSTPLRLLSQLGVVGTALFVVFAVLAVRLALRRRARGGASVAGSAGVALAVFGYWLMHGSLDVFWEVPTLAAPAFGLLGLAAAPLPDDALQAAPARETDPVSPRQLPGVARPAAIAVAAVVIAGACASLVLPWLSASYASSGAAVWREDRELAYSRLERAADLNPLNAQPLVRKGLIAAALGDDEEARRSFERALEREPKGWYPYVQLALIAVDAGDEEEAARYVSRARALNPQDPVLRIFDELLAAGAPIDRDLINRLYNERLNRQSYAFLTTRYIQVPPFTEEGS
jgi:hypothetical protein